MSSTSCLPRFKEAMQSVYGPFETLPQDHLTHWKSPPKSGGHKGRYLWTDAFGVLNFLTLYHETSSEKYLVFAKSLVETVHNVLGRTRDGASRLPGATENEPLKGGLRIGKMDEAGSDGDGQYHHYLTLWMFALNRLSIAARDDSYNAQAISLGKAIHSHFVLNSGGPKRMVWKISSDMKQVLVPSEGHLDAATGYVVYRLLQGGSCDLLNTEIADYKEMMEKEGKLTASSDTLDLGMALWMCHFFPNEDWAEELGRKCLKNSRSILEGRGGILDRSPNRRLAFREFGMCLGISCFSKNESLQTRAATLIEFWEDFMKEVTADDLRPITLVMYAAALIPGAFRKEYFNGGDAPVTHAVETAPD